MYYRYPYLCTGQWYAKFRNLMANISHMDPFVLEAVFRIRIRLTRFQIWV